MSEAVAITGGTTNLVVPPDWQKYDLCSCGELKDPDAKRCQACHLKDLHDLIRIRSAARAQARAFQEWARARS